MTKLRTFHFDLVLRDYTINGKPLLEHLAKHEGDWVKMNQPALGVQARARLLGDAEADLTDGHVAIYVCGMCGDYDGNPVGTRVIFEENIVVWEDLGRYDMGDDTWCPFAKVRGYRFDRAQYVAALHAFVENFSF
jgi:hypothetical protein